ARETGLSPRAWLRRARLSAAAVALASGASVSEAAFASGYGSPSAFVAAYRLTFGVTPGRAFAGHQRRDA
ncbi:MAG: helix-turn-helix domain-containing protein, partial [Candidatus Eremiobacteraeota bacterium]|nr:helix-turn-helix domain-containing protein [Candidatus Eremiobacteraeota bacterium]